MAVANHRDVLEIADRAESAPANAPQREAGLGQAARHWANGLAWLPAVKQSSHYADRVAALNRRLEPLLAQLDFTLDPDEQLPEDMQWMFDNVRLVRMTQGDVKQAAASLRRVPHCRTPDKTVLPRVVAIAQDFLLAVEYQYSDRAFAAYVEAFQSLIVLNMDELSLLGPALKLVVLEEFVTRGEEVLQAPEGERNISMLIGSMRDLSEAPWKELLEPLIVFEQVLAQDPAKAYARMDYASRELYRHTVTHYAEHSDCSEMEIAGTALELAEESTKHPASDPRLAWRRSHVGY